jgi:hypothetical protein
MNNWATGHQQSITQALRVNPYHGVTLHGGARLLPGSARARGSPHRGAPFPG